MNDNRELVDELERLQELKKKTDLELNLVKGRLVAIAGECGVDSIAGSNKVCGVKEILKVVYPEDKAELIELLRRKGLYDEFSVVSYVKLGPRILRGEVDSDVVDLVRKEKGYRVTLRKKG